jgi:hypothetical protein
MPVPRFKLDPFQIGTMDVSNEGSEASRIDKEKRI